MNQLIKLEWDAAFTLFTQSQNIVILGHTPPDADAVSSVVAVGMLCELFGKASIQIIEGGRLDNYHFIPRSDGIQSDDSHIEQADLVIIVDSSAPDIIGAIGNRLLKTNVPKLIIDHHVSNELYGDAHLVRSSAVSTTEVVFDWFSQLEQPISAELAEVLLIGMLSDTQLLSVGNIGTTTFSTISALISCGADYRKLYQQLANRKIPFGHFQLRGLGLHRAQKENGVAWTWLEAAEIEKYDLASGQPLGIADTLVQGEGIVIAAEFLAYSEGQVKVRLRSKDGYNVGAIATELGGGGHERASGCLLQNTTSSQAQTQVLPLLISEATKINLGKAQ